MSGTNNNLLFVGYDFEQKYYRGISFYSKATVNALNSIGYQNYILTSSSNFKNRYLFEYYIKRKMYDPTSFGVNRRRKLLYLLKDILQENSYRNIEQNFYDLNTEKLDYLNQVKGFVNKPYFFELVHARAKRDMKPSKINLSDMGIIFTTSPMYIRSGNNPIIQTLHDIIPILSVSHQNTDDTKIFYNRIKVLLEYSDKVVSVSEFSRQEVLKLFPGYESKIVVTHQPVPIFKKELSIVENEGISNSILNSFRLSKNDYLFYVGFLEKRKNITRLIQAFLSIKDKLDIPLVLGGEIDQTDDELKRLIGSLKKKKHKVIYLGYLSNIEKLVLLKNARAFVFPSSYEGFGLPPIEAFQFDTPVLTSNQASLPEVCGEGAVYVNPFDINSIVEGLTQVSLNESVRRTIVEKGREQLELFSEKRYCDKLQEVFNSVR